MTKPMRAMEVRQALATVQPGAQVLIDGKPIYGMTQNEAADIATLSTEVPPEPAPAPEAAPADAEADTGTKSTRHTRAHREDKESAT